MLLYDFPLTRSSLSIKSLGGLFTRSKSHQQSQLRGEQWLPKTYYELIVAKATSFQFYRYKKSIKAQKVDMQFVNSTDVYGEICQIQPCTVKISESRQYIDILILTLNNGELLVYHYAKDERKFVPSYRDLLFKNKNHKANFQNPRHVGNYITCSEQNHFVVTSIRCHRKLFHVHATLYEDKLKISVRPHDIHIKQSTICWHMAWLPSMTSEQDYLGKYVAIQKNITISESENHRMMIDERDEQRNTKGKKLKYYYVERGFKLMEKEERKEGFKRLQESAHMLIPLSSNSFFIMYENSLYLRQLPNQATKQIPKQEIIDLEFPLRQALVDKNIKCMFSCYSRQFLQDRRNVIYLVNEFGDLFKLEYYMTGGLVANVGIKYVYSVKTCHSIVYVGEVERNSIQLGDHSEPIKVRHENTTLLLLGLERFSVSLYFLLPPQSVQSKPKQTKVAIRPIGKPKTTKTYPQYSDKQSFKPISQRSKDLELSDQIQHKGVIIDTKIANLRSNADDKNQQNFQIFALTNSGNLRHQEHIDQTIDNIQTHKSHLKIIKKGLKTRQINSLQNPRLHQIYCFKKSQKESYHKIAILCAANKTIVYTIASTILITIKDDTFTQFKEMSFEENATSIYIGKLQDDSFIQIYANKVRHIKKEKGGVKQLLIKNRIVTALCLGRQIFVALYGGEIFYFQHDRDKDIIQSRKEFYVNAQVVAMEQTSLQSNKLQTGVPKRASRFLIIATKNYEILIYKLGFKNQKQTTIDLIYQQIIKSPIHSLASVTVIPDDLNSISQKTYLLFLGMENGSFIKMEFDRFMKKTSHKVSNIGSKPVKLKKCSIASKREDSVLIITDKTFIHYINNGKYKTHLIATSNIQLATEMKHPQIPNCLMTFGERPPSTKDFVRIISIESLGEDFHDEKVDLFFSGKKLLVFENNIGIIEADPSYEKPQKRKADRDIDIESNIIEIQNLEKTWKSQFTIYKVKDAKKIAAIYFDQTKEICLCAGYNSIKNGSNPGNYLIFGCAEGMTYYPRVQAKQQTIKIYSWIVEKKPTEKQCQYKTQFLYSLNIDSIPFAIEPFFKGERFLVGVGKDLRLYEVGKKKLLLKAQAKTFSNINQIKTFGKKIFLTSATDSYHLFKYIPEEKTFLDIADDHLPKYITAMNIVDGETVCAGDKFGNLFIGRLNQNAKSQFDAPTGSQRTIDSGSLHKFNTLARINLGDIVTSINKVNLYTSKIDVILYSTVMGQLRVLYPLTEYQEAKVLALLEEKIEEKYNIKVGQGNNWGSRNGVIMGEIVEKFISMSESEQRQILRETKIIDQSYVDYLKDMIEGIRTKII